MTMSDEELSEVARAVSCSPVRSEKVVYSELKSIVNNAGSEADLLTGVRDIRTPVIVSRN